MDSESRVEKLRDSSNWSLWKFQIKVLLNAGDIMDVVNNNFPKPVDDSKPNFADELKLWKKSDHKAQKVIVTAVEHQAMLHIMNCTTAREMWEKLECIYEQKSKASIHMIQQRFYSYSKDPLDNMATHISKLETIVQQMKEMGETVSDSMVTTKILMTLPSCFSHFYSAWESTAQVDQTLANLTSRLMMEEERLRIASPVELNESGALLANKSYRSESKNKQEANKKRNGFKTAKPGKCYLCKESGHWRRDCPQKNRNAKGDAFVSVSKSESSNMCDEDWYLDSGASDHMTCKREWFIDYVQIDPPVSVRIGNGNSIYAYGRGNINVRAFNNRCWENKHLADVLYVPEIHLNLFSSSCALDKGLKLTSDNQKCELTKNGSVVAVGVRQKRLFKMLFQIVKPTGNSSDGVSSSYSAVNQSTSLQLWHERFGHQNIGQVKRFLTSSNIPFVENSNFSCGDCIIGKQHRLPFPASTSRATEPAALVHTDLCGPMQETSIGGAKYFLLFKDDYSQYRSVFFIKEKSEVSKLIEKYILDVKTDINKNIRVLRSDNGLEFINNHVKDILQQHCVRHERSVPYSPQQNGRAERDMRTIVESARTMLHAKELSLRFWAEAVASAVYVLNRSGPTGMEGKPPFQLWFGKPPIVDHLRVFGSEVYTHVPKQQRQKWDKKAKPGIFVGYCDNTKGYRVWNPSTRKVEISRDVIFKEIRPSAATINVEGGAEEGGEHINKLEVSFDSLFKDDAVLAEQVKQCQSPAATRTTPGIIGQQVVEDPTHDSKPPTRDNVKEEDTSNIRSRLRSATTRNFTCNLSEGYAFIAEYEEPATYEAAIQSENSDNWKSAMDDEIESLHKNEVWKLVEKPYNCSIIDSRWIYRVKYNSNGDVERYKSRLVARGFTQQYGIDYEETFSPVVKFTSIRAILGIAAAEKLKLKQFDVKTAFLYGDLCENIYMNQPKGFTDGTDKVCKLQKSLYGLKQSARCWNHTFTSFLNDFGLKATDADPCVFVKRSNEKRKVMLAIYIDDGLIAAEDERDIKWLLDKLQQKFEMKVSDLRMFLGLEIHQLSDCSVQINQALYSRKVLKRFNMIDAVPVSTPADPTSSQGESHDDEPTTIAYPFREAVGSLMYLAVGTRPDIAYAISSVSRHLENPMRRDVTAVKRIMKYIKATADHGILFDSNSKQDLDVFSDADYAGDRDSRRSTSGFVFMLGSGAIAWCSQRQKCVALSTTESEYIAASETVKELVWINRLLMELVTNRPPSPTLFMDNQSAIRLIKNPEYHKRTKHIDVRYHYIRDMFEEELFKIEFISTHEQSADIFTKALPKDRFQFIRNKIGIASLN